MSFDEREHNGAMVGKWRALDQKERGEANLAGPGTLRTRDKIELALALIAGLIAIVLAAVFND